MKLDDVVLRPEQEAFVQEFSAQPGRHLLVAPAGSGEDDHGLDGAQRPCPVKAHECAHRGPAHCRREHSRSAALVRSAYAANHEALAARCARQVTRDAFIGNGFRGGLGGASSRSLGCARTRSCSLGRSCCRRRSHRGRSAARLAGERACSTRRSADEQTVTYVDRVRRLHYIVGCAPFAETHPTVSAHIVEFERDASEVALLDRVASLSGTARCGRRVERRGGETCWTIKPVRTAGGRSSSFSNSFAHFGTPCLTDVLALRSIRPSQ